MTALTAVPEVKDALGPLPATAPSDYMNDNGDTVIGDGVAYLHDALSLPGTYGLRVLGYGKPYPTLYTLHARQVHPFKALLNPESVTPLIEYVNKNRKALTAEYDVNINIKRESWGTTVSLIKKSRMPHTRLISEGTVSEEAYALIDKAYSSGVNILIAGVTDSGKTSFLNTLMDSNKGGLDTVLVISRHQMLFGFDHNEFTEICGDRNSLFRAAVSLHPKRVVIDEIVIDAKDASDMVEVTKENGPQFVMTATVSPVTLAKDNETDAATSYYHKHPFELRIDVEMKKQTNCHVLSVVAIHQIVPTRGKSVLRTLYSGNQRISEPIDALKSKLDSGL